MTRITTDFEAGGAAAVGEVVDRDEHVRLGEVGRGAAAGDVVGDDDEPRGDPALAAELADQVDDLPLDQAELGDVVAGS